IVLSPSGGALAHRYGGRRMLVALSMAAATTLAMLGGSDVVIWIGVLATVILRALLQPLPAPVIAAACPRSAPVPAPARPAGSAGVPALAGQAVWRDIGAAAGPLAGGFLFPILPAMIIYAAAAALFAGASVNLIKPAPGRAGL